MTKLLDDIIKPIAAFGIAASVYLAAQIGMYKMMDNKLLRIEERQGIEYAICEARDTLTSNISPLNYIVIPGFRIALSDYIENNRNKGQ